MFLAIMLSRRYICLSYFDISVSCVILTLRLRCSQFFEFATERQLIQLADQLKGHILELSLQMYGCRVVQKVCSMFSILCVCVCVYIYIYIYIYIYYAIKALNKICDLSMLCTICACTCHVLYNCLQGLFFQI
jgi:hypothetical protein